MAITAACIVYRNASLETLDKLLSVIDGAGIALKAVWANSVMDRPTLELCERWGAEPMGTGRNLGIAVALNQFSDWAMRAKAMAAVVFDEDSQVNTLDLVTLQQEFMALKREPEHCAAIGPRLLDARTGERMVQFTPYTWRRKTLRRDLQADHLITSCMLFDLSVYQTVGPFNENFFIDLVDIEWCLRARSKGYTLHVSPTVTMRQSIGINTKKFGDRSVYVHHPDRNFFQIRNALWLIRHAPMPFSRRLNETAHLLMRIGHILLFGDNRSTRVKFIVRGLFSGFKAPSTQIKSANPPFSR